MNESDMVRAIRIPRELYERIRKWAESRQPTTTIVEAIRYIIERGMKDIERSQTK